MDLNPQKYRELWSPLNSDELKEIIEQQERETVKGGPRSRLMDATLLLLQGRPMRTGEIAEHLKKESKYISSYLTYWKRKGLVYLEGGRWHLTASGESLAKEIAEGITSSRANEYIALAKQIVSEQVSQTTNNKGIKENDKRVQKSLSFVVNRTNSKDKKLQENPRGDLDQCTSEVMNKLDEEEKSVVNYMINRFKVWGSTYVYSDQLQEEMKADSVWLLRVLRQLQSKRVLYIYHDPKLGLRIGFSGKLKKLIEDC